MPYTPQQKRILLDCLDAMAEAEEDAHDSGEDSDDHSPVDDTKLDHAYEIGRLRIETHKRMIEARKDQLEKLRRNNVCSWLHGARSVLTCA
jgi:hypothetical protein